MKERPILFSGPMVRAILEGQKTQTRRIVKFPLLSDSDGGKRRMFMESDVPEIQRLLLNPSRHPNQRGFCPFGKPGDHLWVRETWAETVNVHHAADWPDRHHKPGEEAEDGILYDATIYRADGEWEWLDGDGFSLERSFWKPSIHMPRWASRLTLEITGVRVERLRDISEEDIKAEGITGAGCIHCGESEPCGCSFPTPDSRDEFIHLWESINGPGSWDANPWVWVITFKRVEVKP